MRLRNLDLTDKGRVGIAEFTNSLLEVGNRIIASLVGPNSID